MCYYFFLPGERKSKEDTYSLIRQVLLDIERLLVIRDYPPGPPARLHVGRKNNNGSANAMAMISEAIPGKIETGTESIRDDFGVGLADEKVTTKRRHASMQSSGTAAATTVNASGNTNSEPYDAQPLTLNENDLGMLMLMVHECMLILYREWRRFGKDVKSIVEDLMELSGERGPVSIRQQRGIIERMGRTYGFLKVQDEATVDMFEGW